MEQTARGPVPGQDGLGRGLASSIVTVEELFRLGLFRPASVQRDYQWTECNCATLLADLRHVLDAPEPDAAGRKDAASDAASGDDDPVDPGLIPEMVAEAAPLPSYYLGPMVLTSTTPGNAHAAAPENWIDVYDGLQRLTTLTMLIAILRDLTSQPALRERLGSMVMATPKLARLTLRSGNRIMTDEIHPAGAAATVRKPRKGLTPTEHGIRAACGYFRSAVSRWGQSRIDAFAARLLSDACVGVTEVRDARMARQIFVSTNLHGVRLNRVDLFKGQLIDLAPDTRAAGAMLAAWDRVTRTVAIADPITRVVRDDVDRLLVAVDFIERREHQGVDCLTQLAEHLEKKPGSGGIEDWVANLEKFAGAWRELHERMGEIHARPID